MKKIHTLLICCLPLVGVGCVTPTFIEDEALPPIRLQPVLAEIEAPYYASRPELIFALGPDEGSIAAHSVNSRVRWIKDAAEQGTRIQRVIVEGSPAFQDDRGTSVDIGIRTESLRLSVMQGLLTPESRRQLTAFRPSPTDQLFASVLLDDTNNLDSLITMTELWNGVAASLQERGVPGENIAFGGVIHSPVGRNEILIIKVTP